MDNVRRDIMIDVRYLLNTSRMLYFFYPLNARASTLSDFCFVTTVNSQKFRL